MEALAWFLRFLAAVWPILLILALLLILVGVLRRRSRKRREEEALENAPAASQEIDATVEVVPPSRIPTPRQIRRTVGIGFRTLRKRITSWRLRYRTPCYLLIGPEGAGKTAILQQLSPEIVAPTDPREASGSRWHFFERAVVVEVDGRLLHSSRRPIESSAGWGALLRAIRSHRPERPIDGIILTLPVDELVGPKKFAADGLVIRGREIFQRLQAAQRVLGVQVPIYLLVTKCDLVQGFQEFSDAVPEEARDEIFGWSSPYALETAFIPEWIDQAFDSLGQDISTVQVELLAEGRAPAPEEFFHFSRSFRTLHGPLRTFTAELCRPSAYQEPFYFRGIYFTGDGTSDLGERLAQLPYLGLEGTPSATRESVLPPLPATLPVSRDPVFLTGLFNQKIFSETGLTSPVAQSALSRNRVILGMQAAIAAIIVIGGLGLWRADTVLHRDSAVLLEVLTTIESDLRLMDRASPAAGQGGSLGTAALGNRVYPMLTAMSRIDEARLASVFVPSSWFSSLNRDVDNSMQLGFSNVVLPALRNGILAKADSLVVPSFETSYTVGLAGENMESYLGSIGDLGTNLRRYRAVSTDSALDIQMESLADLATYLYGVVLPPEFLTDDQFYRRALDVSYGTQIRESDRPGYPEDVIRRAERLLRDYYDAVILRLEDIEGRYQSAEVAGQLSATDLGDFRLLRGDLDELDRVFGGTEPYWFDDTRDIGGSLDALLDSIPDTPLTPRDELRREFEEVFYRVRRSKLDELNGRLGNDAVSTDYLTTAQTDDPNVTLPPRLVSLRGALDTLFTQPFLAAAPPDNRPLSLPRTERTRWDAGALDRALQDYEQYQTLLADLPPEYTSGMRRLAQGLASVQLESRLNQGLLDAVSPEPPTYTFGLADRERDLRSRVGAFQDPSTRLIQILEIAQANGMQQTYDELAGAYVELALSLLAETDALLEEGGAYRSVGGGLSNWNGDEPVMDAAFQVGSEDELDEYLAQQRTRIRYLVDNFAAPLLGGLLSPPIADYLGGSGTNALIAKWRDLVEELDQYEAGSGASSLGSLEAFVRDEMGAEDVASCIENSSRGPGGAGDFFLAARNRLRTQLYNRCLQLAEGRARVAYDRLSRYFNLNLAGRYPFAPRPIEEGSPDAGIAELRELYRLVDDLGPFRVAVPGNAGQFLDRLDAVRAFLSPLLALDASTVAPIFDVNVDFRTNRESESGADQIVDWILRIGQARSSYRTPENPAAPWAVGDPIELVLSWALQSDERPDPGGTGYRTDGKQAVYSYRGRWALLSLIQDHLTDGPGGDRGFLLRFDVPTVRILGTSSIPGRNARLYMRLRLDYPEGGSSPPLPYFPARAPEYDE